MDYSRKGRNAIAGFLAVMMAVVVGGCAAHPAAGGAAGGETPETAEELYRQGRAVEDRAPTSPQEYRANLQQARSLYVRALGLKPSAPVEAYIRAGLGNVAFFQDDYRTAVEQFTAAYPNLTDPIQRSMTLLRLGMSQQRLGQFDLADRTFLTLQREFPQSSAAEVARTKYGARQFYVQLAVFSQADLADKAVLKLRKDGFAPSRLTDNQGRQVIRVGPMASYTEAVRVKDRLAEAYPGALISP